MISIREYQARRQKLVAQLPDNSVFVLPSATEVTRSNDTEFLFRQNSYFYYFTGFTEPDACLILSNLGGEYQDLIFCRPTDKQAEIWQGRRVGVGAAAEKLGIAESYDIADLPEALLDVLDGSEQLYFSLGDDAELENMVLGAVEALRKAPKQSKQAPMSVVEPKPLMDEMRLFKSPAELTIMRQAAKISVAAHKRAMRFCVPGAMEYQLEAEIHHEFAMQGARQPAYNTIVGAGDNACILHYTENADVLEEGELVLIDAGAEFCGYAADITRTFPVGGRFSYEQEQLYNLVLNAQQVALDSIKPGNTLKAASDAVIEVITQGLIRFGLLTGDVAENIAAMNHRQFYMHGLGHWLGLDVHDVGNYKVNGAERAFVPGMVLTVEPGIYVAPDANVEARWRGIGVRIEDNVLLTETGYELLTYGLPRTVDEIEQFMSR
ncbi:Xaa-Pro aminopeptidase [Planctobacterium marinum]|uniref:Xaa-Pro aminopeptidase n=1 Tax=Planctobacterium marinum TaxID=1631968 RepID=UPI001E2F7C26|nr:Xaa-Pro aminopeptidase [Planctobacterium marinum]MCC2605757.1 Xaa-Pro aminopeptidase [Planctobacterium marinum]